MVPTVCAVRRRARFIRNVRLLACSLLSSGLLAGLARRAAAQQLVVVTPDLYAPDTIAVPGPNSGPYTATFLIKNLSSSTQTLWLLCYTETRVTCYQSQVQPSEIVNIPAHDSLNVTVTYAVGAAGWGQLTLQAYNSYNHDPTLSGNGAHVIAIGTLGVAVTPDGQPVSQTANTGSHTGSFTVHNAGTDTRTFNLACSATGTVTCGTLPFASVALGAGRDTTVAVPYAVGAVGSGMLRLTASRSAVADTGSYNVAAVVSGPVAPGVTLNVANSGPVIERNLCVSIALTPSVNSECGDLRVVHTLPATRTLSRTRAPVLLYSAQQGSPVPVVGANVSLGSAGIVPDSVTMKLWVCPPGSACVSKAGGVWTGSNWVPGSTRQIALKYDARNDSTNIYRDSVAVTNWYGSSPQTTIATAQRALVNRRTSYFGLGWWLDGLEQLRLPDMIWVGGDGSLHQYTPVVAGSVWVGPSIDVPDTLKKVGTEYIRYLPGKAQVVFDATGKHVRTVNALGHTTTFAYSGVKLSSITLAPAGAGKVYKFAYPTGQVIDSAPPIGATQRVTTITLNAGRITKIRDPNSDTVQFAYGASWWITNRTDRRNHSTGYVYDSAQRVARANIAMSSGPWPTMYLTNAETRGLAGTAAVDTALVYTQIDGYQSGSADSTLLWLNTYGAPRKTVNALGSVTRLYRADARWPGLVTKVVYPNGRIVAADYDTRGHLITSRDSSSYDAARSRYATTTYQWDMGCDAATRITKPEGSYVDFAYDPVTCNRSWQQPGGQTARKVTFFYETTWNLLRATLYPMPVGDPTISRDSIAYDGTTGNVSGTKTPKGYWTSYFPDAIGRDTLVASAIDRTDTSPGTGSTKQRVCSTYDLADRVTRQVTLAPGASGTDSTTVKTYYGPEGLVDSLVRRGDPDTAGVGWIKTTWLYDAPGRKVVEIAPDGMSDTTGYDLASNVTRYVSRRTVAGTSGADRIVTTMVYNSLNQLVQRNLSTVTYVFPTFLTIPADTQRFAYDLMGQVVAADNGDAKVSRTYNPNGTLMGETQRIRTWADTASGGNFDQHIYTLTYRYNLDGARTVIYHPLRLADNLDRQTQYSYDTLTGELKGIRNYLSQSYTFTYAPAGQVASIGYPGGLSELLRYDADGQIRKRIELNKPSHGGWGDLTLDTLRNDTLALRDARGKLLLARSTGMFNGDTAFYSYNGLGALLTSDGYRPNAYWRDYGDTAYHHGFYLAMNERVYDSYSPSALGNVGPHFHSSTTYDAVNQSWTTQQTTGYYRYQASTGRQLGHTPSSGPSSTNTYDASGNLATTVVSGDWNTGRTTWDFYGADEKLRTVQSTTPWDYIAGYKGPNYFDTYRYDALGRRVLVQSQPTSCRDEPAIRCIPKVRRTVWDGDQELWEIQRQNTDESDRGAIYPPDGQPANYVDGRPFGLVIYTHGPGLDRPLDVIRADLGYPLNQSPWGVAAPPFTLTLHYNWRDQVDWTAFGDGSFYMVVSGDPAAEPSYRSLAGQTAYGQVLELADLRWFGTLVDKKLEQPGLMYRRHRYYDAATGRFTQEDPIGLAGGLNLYGYAGADPINSSDPFGLFGCEEHPEACKDGVQSLGFLDDPMFMAIAAFATGGGSLAARGTLAGAEAGAEKVVIGETMTRVRAAAAKAGAETFETSAKTAKEIWKANSSWLRGAIREGKEILDIGEDALRAVRSKFYQAEQELLERRGYPTTKYDWP